MTFKLSEFIKNNTISGPVTSDTLTMTPNETIGLEGTTVKESIEELASDIHELNNLPSMGLDYLTKRNA